MTHPFGIAKEHWQKILSLFSNKKDLQTAVLYGSRAKGNFREGSDIDICLKGSLSSKIIYEILEEYEPLYLPWKLDLVLWNNIENQNLKDHILRVGIQVYPSKGSSKGSSPQK